MHVLSDLVYAFNKTLFFIEGQFRLLSACNFVQKLFKLVVGNSVLPSFLLFWLDVISKLMK